MITFHINSERPIPRPAPGFASLLVVISTGLALMAMLMIMYNDTTQSQETQKNNLLANDYQQREDAVLRALTNIVPNKAILCMKDGSRKKDSNNLIWKTIFDDSFKQANANISTKIIDPTDSAGKKTISILPTLGINTTKTRNANTANATKHDIIALASSVFEPKKYYVSEGSDRHFKSTTAAYPPPIKFKPSKNLRANTNWPVISAVKVYDPSKVTGWVDELSDDNQFGVMPSPSPNFKYGNNGKIIAKHNWWTFNLNFSRKIKDTLLDTAYYTDRGLRQSASKQYIISIYEIPSQLAIHAASYADFGTFQDGTTWNSSNVTIDGCVFAGQVKSTGSFSADAIASRTGVELKNGSNAMDSAERDTALALGTAYNISAAADSGKMAFIPINRGLDFYDRFSANAGKTINFGYDSSGKQLNQYQSGDDKTPHSTVSPTNWDYYSIGANQCVMNLVVTKVISALDQTPTEIEFTYRKNSGSEHTITYTKDAALVDGGDTLLWDESSANFPFTTGATFENRPCINISMENLQTFLIIPLGATAEINRSISVNVDHINNGLINHPYRDGLVDNTTNPVYQNDISLRIEDTEDLHNFTKGFSLVTNLRLIIADNVNMVKISSGSLSGEYPPLSLFSPEKVFGDSAYSATVEIEGQISSLAKAKKDASGNPIAAPAININSGASGATNSQNQITLKGITAPKMLPPINIMNWMVIVREKHN